MIPTALKKRTQKPLLFFDNLRLLYSLQYINFPLDQYPKVKSSSWSEASDQVNEFDNRTVFFIHIDFLNYVFELIIEFLFHQQIFGILIFKIY